MKEYACPLHHNLHLMSIGVPFRRGKGESKQEANLSSKSTERRMVVISVLTSYSGCTRSEFRLTGNNGK